MRTLLRVWGVVPVLVLALALAGCKKKAAEEPEGGKNPLMPNPSGGGPAPGVVQRGAQRQVNQSLMRNLGQYYALFRTENGRPPKSLEEFKTYVKSDPNARNEAQALESDWVVLVIPPNKVLAYEKDAFQAFNNRLVLFADGSVKLVEDAEFQAALKGQ
jgi:hypothetical protein